MITFSSLLGEDPLVDPAPPSWLLQWRCSCWGRTCEPDITVWSYRQQKTTPSVSRNVDCWAYKSGLKIFVCAPKVPFFVPEYGHQCSELLHIRYKTYCWGLGWSPGSERVHSTFLHHIPHLRHCLLAVCLQYLNTTETSWYIYFMSSLHIYLLH